MDDAAPGAHAVRPNITFHILFPTITIALGWVLLFFRVRYERTREAAWLDAYRFWTKVFALTFALGVVQASR